MLRPRNIKLLTKNTTVANYILPLVISYNITTCRLSYLCVMSADSRTSICVVVIIFNFIVPSPHNTSQIWIGWRSEINILPYVIESFLLLGPPRVMPKATPVSMILGNLSKFITPYLYYNTISGAQLNIMYMILLAFGQWKKQATSDHCYSKGIKLLFQATTLLGSTELHRYMHKDVSGTDQYYLAAFGQIQS